MANHGHRRHQAIAVSLSPELTAEADRLASALRREGWPLANRSLVFREAVIGLCDELAGKTDAEIFRYFIDRRGRRICVSK